jgi:hypothetical protein
MGSDGNTDEGIGAAFKGCSMILSNHAVRMHADKPRESRRSDGRHEIKAINLVAHIHVGNDEVWFVRDFWASTTPSATPSV